ncbi:MAG: cytosine permease [Bacillota bacterium]|nr:cytosine permease [Bacillota bacterium]
MVSPDVLPTRQEDRHLTARDMGIMWVGMSVLLTTFTIGSTLYPSLSVASILWAAGLGNFIVIIVMLFTGDIGIKYGIPMAVYLRAVYGVVGTHIPSIIRALPAMFWFGFQSFLGASAINSLLYILTDGGWPGNFVTMIIVLIIFIFVQAFTTARGINVIAWFEKLVSPLMVAIALYMLYWIMTKAGLSIGDVLSVPAGDVGDGPKYSFGYAVHWL